MSDAARLADQLAAIEPEARRLAAQGLASIRSSDATALLLRALGDSDWRVRKEAAAVAPRIEGRIETIAALVSALHERDDVGLRNAAVEALVAIGTDAVGPTIRALGELDADGRKLALEVLAGIQSEDAVRALARSLDDEDTNVRVAAAEGLGRAGGVGDAARRIAIEALVSALGASDVYVKLGILDSLNRLEARLPWRVCEPLMGDPLLRRHALAILARSDEAEAVAALARSVADPSPAVAREAVVALGDAIEQKGDDEELMTVARDTLRPSRIAQERVRSFAQREDDPKARGAALATLGLVKDPQDVPLLVDALADDDVAERAELGLQLFGETAVGPMLDAARTAPPPARSASISMAPMLSGTGDADVVAALRAALDDGSPDVVSAALSSLGRAGDAADMWRIADLVTHADARVASAACDALVALAERFAPAARVLLARLEPAAADAVVGCLLLRAVGDRARPEDVSYLRTALAHGDARVRKEAASAFGAVGGPAATDAVSFALTDEEREVVIAAARALARMGLEGDEVVGKLAGLLDHPAWEVRRVAVDLLGRTATPAALELLLERAKTEPEPVVRAGIVAFVGEDE